MAFIVGSLIVGGVAPVGAASGLNIRIDWTDTGVYMVDRPECLKDPYRFMFQSFPEEVKPVRFDVPAAGQILIPMPENHSLPKTSAEWDSLQTEFERGIMYRIERALDQGVTDFEIRTVQNITIKTGYWAPWQQARVAKFGETFLKALTKVRGTLRERGSVQVRGMVGSNGGFLATEAIARLQASPLDRLTIVDGRAHVDKTLTTARVMKGHLTIVNTGGDAWALPDLVAHHGGARFVKAADPSECRERLGPPECALLFAGSYNARDSRSESIVPRTQHFGIR